MADRRLTYLLLGGMLLGCAPKPAAPLVTGADAPRSDASDAPGDSGFAPGANGNSLPNHDWQRVVSQQFRLTLELPDAAGWSTLHDERWWTLSHSRSQSTLRLRTWVASPRVKKEECLAQVYLWQSHLRSAAEPMLSRSLAAPRDYDVALRIDVGLADGKAAIVAYGAKPRRCYAAVFETSDDGGQSQALAARLSMLVEGSFQSVEVLEVEARALADDKNPPGS